MRVLCAIGIRYGVDLVRRSAQKIGTSADYVLLNVIDSGPRRGLERLGGPLHPPPPPPPSRHPPPPPHHERDLDEAEQAAGEEALREALDTAHQLGLRAETRLERGEPEHVIVELAQQLHADLIAIRSREHGGHPPSGPASVGHTARFVLDHAPCDVLLLRKRE